ncbi:SNF2 family N-terminal domain-containing protein [Daldinia sp. FL1419]|nr:SNF2 family N-terminal domain-containing protein [Daldinia sp. FL1419]
MIDRTSLANIKQDIKGPLSNNQLATIPKKPESALDGLRYPLYPHQSTGLEWMKKMERDQKKRGGILADDMGLGKTLSTIALMISRDDEPQPWSNVKTNLIIAPVSLLKQWEREIKQKLLPGHQLEVFSKHSKKADYYFLRNYDVVLTSYGMLVSESKRMQQYINQATRRGREINDGHLAELCPLLSPRSIFYRVILDEAQCIKNHKAQVSTVVCRLQAKYRWCLTGTPMQNGPIELASLIRFLQIEPYCHIDKFKRAFKSLQPQSKGESAYNPAEMKELQNLLHSILLRRTKKSEINGKPIIQLKEKIEVIDHVVFDPDQQEFYQVLEKSARVQFGKYLKAGSVGKHYGKILVLLLRLRQACCHPYLHLADLEIEVGVSGAEAQKAAQILPPEKVECIQGTQAFKCSVCSDLVQRPSIMCPCGDLFCSDCAGRFMDTVERNEARAIEKSAECPACHSQGSPTMIKFGSFLTFCQTKQLGVGGEVKLEDEGEVKLKDDNDDDTTDDSDSDPEDEINPDELLSLCRQARNSQQAHDKYMATLRAMWQPSAKVTKCCELISNILETTNEKIIVFSQWTVFLDIIQIAIEDQLKLQICRYDGSMSATKRDDTVTEFMENPNKRVILVSLKAGNAGLNLTVASQVFIMDPFWNPYVENQAVDRAYRIGQQRDVTVHRMLVAGTVEDRIMATQEKKRRIVESALEGENIAKEMGGLGTDELKFLFDAGS